MPPSPQNLDAIPVGRGMAGAALAVQLLTVPEALTGLTMVKANVVVRYIAPHFFPVNTTFIREGDAGGSGFMAFLIEDDVVVERFTVSRTAPVNIAERLRETNRQPKLCARLTTAMREELTSVSTPAAGQPTGTGRTS